MTANSLANTFEQIRTFVASGQALLDGGELPDYARDQVDRAVLMVEQYCASANEVDDVR